MSRVHWYFCLLLLVFLVSCGGGKSTLPPDTLVVGIIGDMDTVNYYASQSRFTADITKLLYPQLMAEQPDFTNHPPSFKPSLASSWEVSEDGRTYTFHLVEGAVWSDSTPITADDVLFSHHAAMSDKVGWSGIDSKTSIESVEAPDPHTVVFRLKAAYPYALMDINEGRIVPKHVWEKVPMEKWTSHDFSVSPVVGGPYTVGEWKRQEHILLTANPAYFRKGYPKIPKILYQIIPDQHSLLQQLLTGNIDVMAVIPPKDAKKVEENPNLNLVRFPDIQFGYIGWNLADPLFESKKVRQAMTMAVNRQAIIDTVWYGYASVACSPILSSFWAYNRSLESWPYNPEEARRLLKEEGWEDTDGDGILDRDGKAFTFTIQTNSGNKIRSDIAVLVQKDLAGIGVKAEIQLLEFNVFIERLMGKEFEACINGLAAATKLDMRDLWHSNAINPSQGINVISYRNSEVDRILVEVQNLPLEEQVPLWHRFQELVHEDQPFTFLYENERLNGVSTRLTHHEMNMLSSYFNMEAWTLAQ